MEGLLEAFCSQAGQGEGARETALLLSAAAVELLRGHPLLADHAVGLGYADRLLKLLATRVPATSKGVHLISISTCGLRPGAKHTTELVHSWHLRRSAWAREDVEVDPCSITILTIESKPN